MTTRLRVRVHSVRRRQRGVVLPLVLSISAMLLATSAAFFDTSLASARSTANTRDALQAFHAADTALERCARGVVNDTSTAGAGGIGAPHEPVGWKSQTTFAANAIAPFTQWPGSARAPQCLVEAWQIAGRPDARAFVISARGFGASRDTQAWAQMQLVIDGNEIERHWRRIVSRPF